MKRRFSGSKVPETAERPEVGRLSANDDDAAVLGAVGDHDTVRDDALIDQRIASHLHIVPQNRSRDACGVFDPRAAADRRAGSGRAPDERLRCTPVVGGRADIPELGVADKATDGSRARRDQRIVHAADRAGGLARRQRLEYVGLDDLTADVVIRALRRCTRGVNPTMCCRSSSRTPRSEGTRGSGRAPASPARRTPRAPPSSNGRFTSVSVSPLMMNNLSAASSGSASRGPPALPRIARLLPRVARTGPRDRVRRPRPP